MDNGKNSLRKKVLSGLAWVYAERLLAQGVSFAVSILLARLLEPEHYGTIAIVNIFILIFNIFVTSGLGSSLIQKKDTDAIDFSVAFTSGVIIAFILYIPLYVFAPSISRFYHMPILTSLLRVLGLRLPIAALNTVQHAYISKQLIFKKFFVSTLLGTILSAIAGIYMAYRGFGVWALVGQYMINTIVNSIVLIFILPWKPKLKFSISRFKLLYSFGWKLLACDLIYTLSNNLRSLAIGKKYTSADLAFYDRGQQFTNMIIGNIDNALINVLFPAISKYQDNKAEVKSITRRAIKTGSFILSPILVGLAAASKPLIILLLTDKWVEVVPYLQMFCLAYLFQPMQSSNLQALKAIGRSDINLKLEIIKNTYGVIILLVSIVFFNDPFVVAVGFVLSTLISVLVNAVPSSKLLDYGYCEQLKDIAPQILIACVMGVAVYLLRFLDVSMLVMLILQIALGSFLYVCLAFLFKIESLTYVRSIIKSFFISH